MAYEDDILRFVSLAPPHEVIAYLCHRAGISRDEIVAQHAATPLRELLEALGLRFAATPKLRDEEIVRWLDPLRKNLQRKIGDLLRNKKLRAFYADLLDSVYGETCLNQFSSSEAVKDVIRWSENIEDLRLVAKWLNNDQSAIDSLCERHEKGLKGLIGMRIKNSDDLKEVYQNAWLKIVKGLSKFNPALGPVGGFLKGCARNVLRDFYDKAPRMFEVPPEDDDDKEPEEAYDDPEPWVAELFEKFMATAFRNPREPYQLLAFGFVNPLEWNPAEVVKELSDVRLDALTKRLEMKLCDALPQRRSLVEKGFQNLHRIMREGTKVSKVLKEPKTRETFSRLLDRVVAETMLRDYYTSDAAWNSREYLKASAQNISDWCFKVRKRILGDLGENDC